MCLDEENLEGISFFWLLMTNKCTASMKAIYIDQKKKTSPSVGIRWFAARCARLLAFSPFQSTQNELTRRGWSADCGGTTEWLLTIILLLSIIPSAINKNQKKNRGRKKYENVKHWLDAKNDENSII